MSAQRWILLHLMDTEMNAVVGALPLRTCTCWGLSIGFDHCVPDSVGSEISVMVELHLVLPVCDCEWTCTSLMVRRKAGAWKVE